MASRRKGKPQKSSELPAKPADPPHASLIPPRPADRVSEISIAPEKRAITATSQSFSGPIPHPSILREYNAIIPGLAEQIVAQAKQQTDHRIRMEKQLIESDTKRAHQGLVCGFVLAMSCIIGGVIAVLMGHDWAGASIATCAVVALAGVFVYGTTIRKAERAEKAKLMAEIK